MGCLPGFQSGIRLFFVELFVLSLQPAAETLVPVKDRPPPGGREGHGQGRLQMAAAEVFLSCFQALQEVGEHLNSTFTSAFIFPISAGQTENLINCMKPK